ncbi:hypothetical protein ACHAXA_004785 [Cyclostephanos tholiformis]|uniref:RPA-interacting protein C-terminal domain-containing protein n=1 Tax=Cyclostephanos tholiformis TaxID=382380 RepID=A0ABD3R7H1_9STRA
MKVRRGNIKAVSHSQTKAQWKDIIRRGCLKRAKIARRRRLRRSRLHDPDNDDGIGLGGYRTYDPPVASNVSSDNSDMTSALKRDRDESDSDWNINDYITEGGDFSIDSHAQPRDKNDDRFDHDIRRLVTGIGEHNAVDTARALVELELQCALSGMQHHRQISPLDGGAPWKKTNGGGVSLREANGFQAIDDMVNGDTEKYTMSHEEFLELLNDVTEELQRDDELLEKEISELERAEAMELERLMHQIDDFVSWDELQQTQLQHSRPNTYISPLSNLNSPFLMCPICNSFSLMETPSDGLKCNRAAGNGSKNCSFQLDVAHEGLTLNHLHNQLRAVYEEHSQVCPRGVLKFCIEKRVGVSILMAKCDVCSSDVVVI